jgi:hypothetical protein
VRSRVAASLRTASAFALGAATTTVAAQTLPMKPPPFAPLRYDDDAITRTPSGISGNLKYISLGVGISISFGGEVRERYEHYTGEAFGLAVPRNDGYDLSRVMAFTDVHFGSGWRAFVELASHFAPGKQQPLDPPDKDTVDLHQAFLDIPISTWVARLGRQEMMIGSGRFVDIREGPNVRQTHDGARIMAPLGNGRLDLFALRPTETRPGAFDDKPDHHQSFVGAYLSMPIGGKQPLSPYFGIGAPPPIAIDAYYFWLRTTQSPFHPQPGTENRHVVGTRLWGAAKGWDYDLEGQVQLGRSDRRTIRAGGASLKAGYTFPGVAFKPRLGFQSDWFSGDRDPDDRIDGTTDPLFPRGGWFSEPGLQTFSNIIDAYPSVTFNPWPVLAIQTGVNFVWRQTTGDAVYITPGVPIPRTAGAGGRYTGTNGIFQVSWQATPNFNFGTSIVRIWTAESLKRIGARNITYTAFWGAFKF